MVINFPVKNESLYKKNRNYKKKVKPQKKSPFLPIISLILILLTSIYITNTIYVYKNSKDLQFAVEHSLTSGFSSKDKLLRVQTLSLISNDGENAVVTACGLSKLEPHKNTSITASFKRGDDEIWHLEKILDN